MFEKVRDIICEQFECDEELITMDTDIMEDLDVDSLDVTDLIMDLESEFQVEVPEDQIENFRTVGDVVRFLEENV